ncbi:MAG: hypothetical protein ACFFA8_15215 [Promethearchaeota archaeon]
MNLSIILRRVAIFFLIFSAGIHILVYSTYFVAGSLILDDLAYSELTWAQLGNSYPHLAYLISLYIRMMGIIVVIVEVFVLFAVYLIFWKSSKQAFITATIGSLVPLIMELIQTFPILNFNIPYMAYIMLTVITAFALVIAGKELFVQKIN